MAKRPTRPAPLLPLRHIPAVPTRKIKVDMVLVECSVFVGTPLGQVAYNRRDEDEGAYTQPGLTDYGTSVVPWVRKRMHTSSPACNGICVSGEVAKSSPAAVCRVYSM